mmetsp:Transcript_84311/g.172044  ORF Transcript_84311/g.172044 Transcript_84311/m.172044 type:complete len:327 (-) Transcript_84311:1290-2270(-)
MASLQIPCVPKAVRQVVPESPVDFSCPLCSSINEFLHLCIFLVVPFCIFLALSSFTCLYMIDGPLLLQGLVLSSQDFSIQTCNLVCIFVTLQSFQAVHLKLLFRRNLLKLFAEPSLLVLLLFLFGLQSCRYFDHDIFSLPVLLDFFLELLLSQKISVFNHLVPCLLTNFCQKLDLLCQHLLFLHLFGQLLLSLLKHHPFMLRLHDLQPLLQLCPRHLFQESMTSHLCTIKHLGGLSWGPLQGSNLKYEVFSSFHLKFILSLLPGQLNLLLSPALLRIFVLDNQHLLLCNSCLLSLLASLIYHLLLLLQVGFLLSLLSINLNLSSFF